MADPLSTTASVLTILEVIRKAVESGIKIKNAPASWLQYLDELESVGHLQSVLRDILKTADAARVRDIPPIDLNGKPTNLVDFIDERLMQVTGQAKYVLGAMYKEKTNKTGYRARWRARIRKSVSSIEFFIKEEKVRDLFQAVTHAKSSLQLALAISQLYLSTTAVSHQDVGTLLKSMKDEMVKHSGFIDSLQSSSHLPASEVETSHPSRPSIQLILNRPRRRSARRKRRQSTRLMLPSATLPTPDGSAAETAVSDQERNSSSGYEDLWDDGETSTSSSKKPQGMQDQLVLDEACDTELANCHVCQRAVTTKESETMVQEDPEPELQPCFCDYDAPNTAEYNTAPICDSKSVQDGYSQATFIIENQAEAIIFGNRQFGLESCTASANRRYTFCVLHITAKLGRQFFFLGVPCAQDTMCEHIIMESLDIGNLLPELPMRATLAFNNPGDWNGPGRDPASGSMSLHLPVHEGCMATGSCLHSLVESEGDLHAQCAIQSRLFGSIHPHFWYEPGKSPPRDLCSYQLGDGCGAYDDNDFQEQPRTPQLSEHPAPDDDKGAFILARNSMLNIPAGLPTEVTMDMLIKFLLLVDKYQLTNGPIEQARKWAGLLLLQPASVDQETSTTWLWILWKVGMKAEFKTLSSLIQQHAECRLDQAVGLYQVTLPQTIIDQVETTRLSALNQLHDLINSQLDSIVTEHLEYLERITHHRDLNDCLFPGGRVLTNSLLFGYLALAKESWLYPEGARSRTNGFSGASFSKIATHVRSMITLEEYMVAPVPLAHRLPAFVSAVSRLIPVVGSDLRAVRSSAQIPPPAFKDELESLIDDLEREELWGIELP